MLVLKMFDKELSYEQEFFIQSNNVRKLRTRVIQCLKVQLRNHTIKEGIWETEIDIHKKNLCLVINLGTSYSSCYISKTVAIMG